MKIMEYQAVVLATMVLLAGCRTTPKHMYEGFPRAFNEIATISGTSASNMQFSIVAVDGKRTLSFFERFVPFTEYPTEVYLLPGMHRISIQGLLGTFFVKGHVVFNAQNMKGYRVSAQDQGACIRFVMEDTSTGAIVGASKYTGTTGIIYENIIPDEAIIPAHEIEAIPLDQSPTESRSEKIKALRDLKALHVEGIMTDEEYEVRRKKIVNDL